MYLLYCTPIVVLGANTPTLFDAQTLLSHIFLSEYTKTALVFLVPPLEQNAKRYSENTFQKSLYCLSRCGIIFLNGRSSFWHE